MGNLNLAIPETRDNNGKKNGQIRGIPAAIALIIFIGIAYAGAFLYESNMLEKINLSAAQYGEEYQKLTGEKNKNIVDFQNRITTAKNLLQERNFSLESFSEMEKIMVSGAQLDSYDYEKSARKITVKCEADNFNIMAEQIASFKKSAFFSEVEVGKSGINDKNKVLFEAELKIKN